MARRLLYRKPRAGVRTGAPSPMNLTPNPPPPPHFRLLRLVWPFVAIVVLLLALAFAAEPARTGQPLAAHPALPHAALLVAGARDPADC